jgi:hypothetical protein
LGVVEGKERGGKSEEEGEGSKVGELVGIVAMVDAAEGKGKEATGGKDEEDICDTDVCGGRVELDDSFWISSYLQRRHPNL